MKTSRVVLAAAIGALITSCEAAPLVKAPARTTPSSRATAAPSAPVVIDARIEFEEGADPSFGENVTTVRGILSVPALATRRVLFSVPYPYRCVRKGDGDLTIECLGDDGSAFASLRIEAGHVLVKSRDYGRLTLDAVAIDLPLPANATANVYAPAKLPTSY